MFGTKSAMIAAVLTSLFASRFALGEKQVQTFTANFGETPLLSCVQFDPALGVLKAADYRVDYDLTIGLAFENLQRNDRIISAEAVAFVLLQAMDPQFATYYFAGQGPGYSYWDWPVHAFDGVVDFNGDSGLTSPVYHSVDGFDMPVAPADLPFYTGVELLYVDFWVESFDNAGDNFIGRDRRDVATYHTGGGSATLTLTYTYVGCGCDANCDGSLNQFDVPAFVALLSGDAPCAPCAGDANHDGSLNSNDISGFLDCLAE